MSITRREMLRGLSLGAGAAAMTPVLPPIRTRAAEAPRTSRRFVFVVEGNGLPWRQIQPLGIERGDIHERTKMIDVPLAGHDLPEALEPLDAYNDRVTIVQGLSGRIAGGGHSTNFGALGCYHGGPGGGKLDDGGGVEGETIDAALGKRLGGVFPQVGLGISSDAAHDVIYNCSAWGRGRPVPTICKPMTAYRRLFGGAAAAPRDAANRTAHAPVVTDKYTSEVETDRLDAHFDLAAAALIRGLTNVVTIASGVGDPYFGVRFTGLGIPIGKHTIGHGGSYRGMSASDMAVTIRRFHFELIARLMKALDAAPEGDGTMLDHTTIVYLSDAAEAHHSRCFEWPCVIIGHAGGLRSRGLSSSLSLRAEGRPRGALRQGRYLEYPSYGNPGHRELGNLYTTLLHTTGDTRPYFGVHDPQLDAVAADGPLVELLARTA